MALDHHSSAGLAPSEKINLAVIGIGNQGYNDLRSMMNSGLCNVVALCDVDLEGRHVTRQACLCGKTSDSHLWPE